MNLPNPQPTTEKIEEVKGGRIVIIDNHRRFIPDPPRYLTLNINPWWLTPERE